MGVLVRVEIDGGPSRWPLQSIEVTVRGSDPNEAEWFATVAARKALAAMREQTPEP